MIKSILGGKSKNLFDISKVITSSVVKRNGNSLICSVYGTSIGTLGSICPTLKLSDTITVSFKYASEGAPSNFMAFGTRVFNSGATFIVSEIGLSTPWYLYNTDGEHRDLPNKTTYSDIQLEVSTNATEYVPHELTSYKSIMKVSDVCQLANSKLFTPMNGDTVDFCGVSITKNIEAGTITFNGTSTNNFWYHVHDYGSELRYTNLIKGYKYYISGMPVNDLGVAFQLTSLFKLQGEQIFTAPTTSNGAGPFDIYVPKGVTLTDFVVTPQLFDLTEMFGAGNEPKTVAEFRQRFPNEYYPYSPQCWLTSYKSAVVCKTKNLFDVNNAVPYIFNNDNPDGNLIWLKDGIYTTRINNYNVGSGLRIKNGLSLPAGTYTVSAKIVDFYNINRFNIGFIYKDKESKWHYVNAFEFPNRVGVGDTVAFRYDIPEHTDLRLYLNYQTNDGVYLTGYVSYKDIQLEQGSTATDYVPYGYV